MRASVVITALLLLLHGLGSADAAPRIGYLLSSSLSEQPSPERQAFIDGLKALGWDVGRNLVIEYRAASFNEALLEEYAEELIKLPVDVIVAVGSKAVEIAAKKTRAIPIVAAASADPVGTGYAASLARPGGNVTGVTTMAPELGPKRLELLRELLPKASRVTGLWNESLSATDAEWKATAAAAPRLGFTVGMAPIRTVQDLDPALREITRQRPAALVVLFDSLTSGLRMLIVEFAARQRLPAVYGVREFVEAGGLMSYGPHMPDLFRRAAAAVDRILRGAKAADVPIEQPTKFELVINLRTAKALGLAIPPALLLRADGVIR